jgi:uncharacterized protein
MSESLLIIIFLFFAVFTQSLSGFGVALVAMGLLPTLLPINVAVPLVSLVMVTIEIFLLIRYRHAFNWGAIWQVIAASIVGIPIGLFFLSRLDEKIVLTILGIFITAYALYALSNVRLPALRHPAWAYGFGLLAGMLGGTYNTSGPPVIVYGNCRGWEPDEFKSNLQGFFVVSSLVIALGHAWNGNLSPEVWRYYLLSIPAMITGILAGTSLDRFVNPVMFRKIVLGLLIVMGLRLIFS